MSSEQDNLILDREKLRLGKYTRSFARLTSDQLEGLLWLLGEWSIRRDSDHPRARTARQALLDFGGNPLTLEEVHTLIRGAREERPDP